MTPQASSLTTLPPEVKSEVDELLKGGATIAEIVEHLQALGHRRSMSAVGRYKKRFEDVARKMREAREIAAVWVEKLGEEPDGDIGRLAIEMMSTVSFNTLLNLQEGEAPVGADALFFLAKALKETESARKISVERELKIRREVVQAAAKEAASAAKAEGLSEDTVEKIKKSILGVAA